MVLSFDLQDFILRAQVLKLYRQALRTARRAPDHARGRAHCTANNFPEQVTENYFH
uniref:Complex 1 LYR protein domain-containing protein n=1 Tax=Rhizophora mucronata TaxID=61149 RepID=A0A2P2JP42_RHIMU